MDERYLYLVHFSPALMKKKAVQKRLQEEGGMQTSLFTKRYAGIRIESEHKLDQGWLTDVLSEYGNPGEIQEYICTEHAADLPSRPLSDAEAKSLEKELRRNYTVGSLFLIILFGILGSFGLYGTITTFSPIYMILSIVAFVIVGFQIKRRKKDKEEAAAMVFTREDWGVVNGNCCNSWTETREDTTVEINDPNRQITEYYCQMAAGGFALCYTFSNIVKSIGDPVSFFYNRTTNAIERVR